MLLAILPQQAVYLLIGEGEEEGGEEEEFHLFDPLTRPNLG